MNDMSDRPAFSLLYVSHSLLELSQAIREVEDIVKVSRPRNASLSVTGALIFTEVHFAQILEGPQQGVDELMTSICRDKRHRDVTIIHNGVVPARRFANWSLAYAGPASYVAEAVEEALDDPTIDSGANIDRLVSIMQEFAKQN
jgi:hypothetical protein